MQIGNPKITVCVDRRCDIIRFNDRIGYAMDYDLTTNGARNDLTIQIEFWLNGSGYNVVLDDLHAL